MVLTDEHKPNSTNLPCSQLPPSELALLNQSQTILYPASVKRIAIFQGKPTKITLFWEYCVISLARWAVHLWHRKFSDNYSNFFFRSNARLFYSTILYYFKLTYNPFHVSKIVYINPFLLQLIHLFGFNYLTANIN